MAAPPDRQGGVDGGDLLALVRGEGLLVVVDGDAGPQNFVKGAVLLVQRGLDFEEMLAQGIFDVDIIKHGRQPIAEDQAPLNVDNLDAIRHMVQDDAEIFIVDQAEHDRLLSVVGMVNTKTLPMVTGKSFLAVWRDGRSADGSCRKSGAEPPVFRQLLFVV